MTAANSFTASEARGEAAPRRATAEAVHLSRLARKEARSHLKMTEKGFIRGGSALPVANLG
jgi:hypothetical protein